MFLSINEEHYRRFILNTLITSLLQKVTKHCPTNATSRVDLRSGHFQVKTDTEVRFFSFNVNSLLVKTSTDNILKYFFLFSPDNGLQHFMQIVTFRDN